MGTACRRDEKSSSLLNNRSWWDLERKTLSDSQRKFNEHTCLYKTKNQIIRVCFFSCNNNIHQCYRCSLIPVHGTPALSQHPRRDEVTWASCWKKWCSHKIRTRKSIFLNSRSSKERTSRSCKQILSNTPRKFQTRFYWLIFSVTNISVLFPITLENRLYRREIWNCQNWPIWFNSHNHTAFLHWL